MPNLYQENNEGKVRGRIPQRIPKEAKWLDLVCIILNPAIPIGGRR